jgi:hypothetical protein
MLVYESFEKYLKHIDGTSKNKQYRAKVYNYLRQFWNDDVVEALNRKKMTQYILDPLYSPENKRVALLDYYSFLSELGIADIRDFPVSKEEALAVHSKNSYIARKGNLVILDKHINLEEFFKDDYYYHLNNDVARVSCKAVIGICLAIGFDTKELFEDEPNYLQVNDITIVNESTVIVNHNNYQKEFEVSGRLGQYISEYYEIRKRYPGDCFFIKLWRGKELKHDNSVRKRKPSDLKGLVYYMLEYICNKNNIAKLSITDLRANMVYRSLISSKGASLVDIINFFGYVTFVEVAFLKYIEDFNINDDRVPNFFYIAPQDSNDGDSGADEKYYTYNLHKKFRDRKIVADLKKLYNYQCQVCGVSLHITKNIKYIEAHHI